MMERFVNDILEAVRAAWALGKVRIISELRGAILENVDGNDFCKRLMIVMRRTGIGATQNHKIVEQYLTELAMEGDNEAILGLMYFYSDDSCPMKNYENSYTWMIIAKSFMNDVGPIEDKLKSNLADEKILGMEERADNISRKIKVKKKR